MDEKNMWHKTLISIILIFSLTACTTLQTVIPEPHNIQNTVQMGDHVRVTTIAGQTYHFEVAQVTPKALIGVQNQQVLFNQIKTLQLAQPNDTKTVIGGVGILYILSGIAIVAVLISAAA